MLLENWVVGFVIWNVDLFCEFVIKFGKCKFNNIAEFFRFGKVLPSMKPKIGQFSVLRAKILCSIGQALLNYAM